MFILFNIFYNPHKFIIIGIVPRSVHSTGARASTDTLIVGTKKFVSACVYIA